MLWRFHMTFVAGADWYAGSRKGEKIVIREGGDSIDDAKEKIYASQTVKNRPGCVIVWTSVDPMPEVQDKPGPELLKNRFKL